MSDNEQGRGGAAQLAKLLRQAAQRAGDIQAKTAQLERFLTALADKLDALPCKDKDQGGQGEQE